MIGQKEYYVAKAEDEMGKSEDSGYQAVKDQHVAKALVWATLALVGR